MITIQNARCAVALADTYSRVAGEQPPHRLRQHKILGGEDDVKGEAA